MAGISDEGKARKAAVPPVTADELRRQLSGVRVDLDALADRLDQTAAADLRAALTAAAGQLTRLAEGLSAEDPGGAAACPAAAPARARVLLVDDELLAVDCIMEYLDGRGYEVLPAGSPRDALALAARRMIDVVVTDLRMVGMDGQQLVSELRRDRPGLPAVVVTGHLGTRIEDDGGPTLVMRKPLALDRLETAIAELLAAGGMEPAR